MLNGIIITKQILFFQLKFFLHHKKPEVFPSKREGFKQKPLCTEGALSKFLFTFIWFLFIVRVNKKQINVNFIHFQMSLYLFSTSALFFMKCIISIKSTVWQEQSYVVNMAAPIKVRPNPCRIKHLLIARTYFRLYLKSSSTFLKNGDHVLNV